MDEPAMDETVMTPTASLLVLGGARSGKSSYAQRLAEGSGFEPVFVATAEPWDEEMRERIGLHVAARGHSWATREAPHDLVGTLNEIVRPDRVVLVDCLTLWLSNLMLRDDDVDVATRALVALVPSLAGPAIFVSNEVGAGIVPDTPLGRRFRDAQGRANQAMATACDAVVLVTAGLPRQLKPAPLPTVVMGTR